MYALLVKHWQWLLVATYRLSIYSTVMIKSYSCRDTEKLANNYRVRRFMAFERIAQRKLMQLKAAATLDMLRTPPGNRLEALKSNRKGQYSIRINGQWRLCFRFENGHAYNVEIVDYH
ncbi:MAG: proteic killer suppression protein [Bermanella sp.]|jgi:proteic killer suppression protein